RPGPSTACGCSRRRRCTRPPACSTARCPVPSPRRRRHRRRPRARISTSGTSVGRRTPSARSRSRPPALTTCCWCGRFDGRQKPVNFQVAAAHGDLPDEAAQDALAPFGVETVESPTRRRAPPLDCLLAGHLGPLLSGALLGEAQTLAQTGAPLGGLRQPLTDGVDAHVLGREVEIE